MDRTLWLREYIGANHKHADTEAGTYRIEAIFHCTPEGDLGQIGGQAENEIGTQLSRSSARTADKAAQPGGNGLLPVELLDPLR